MRSLRRRLAATDLVCIALAAAGAHLIRIGDLRSRLTADDQHVPFLTLTVALVVSWLLALHWFRSRSSRVIGNGPDEFKRVINATVGLFGIVAIGSFVFSLNLPRSYVLVMMPAGLTLLLLERYLWRRWLRGQRERGKCVSSMLVVGAPHAVEELNAELSRSARAGYRVVGVCTRLDTRTDFVPTSGPGRNALIGGVPVLGGLDAVADVAADHGVDAVAVTASAEFTPKRVRELSWELEKSGTGLILAPALTNIAGPRVHTQPVAGLPLIHVDRPTYRGANQILKRSFDLVVAGVITMLFSPLMIAVASAVKLTSAGPVFFRQERVGLDGRTFRMIKFRSMVADAEDRLPELAARGPDERGAGNHVMFKVRDDPRITTVGKVIRRLSLDELPQLFNVLGGSMSLVGPRPPLVSEVEKYEDEVKRRLLVKPGMTGLWQISGRSKLNWDDTVRLDLYYVENWSLTGDLAILMRTAKAVLSSDGAC